MRKFFAAPGSPFTDEDAERLGPELVALAEAGVSSSEEIVAYAKGTDTPLREALHLDRPMEEAADAWYRFRARKVAGAIMVKVQAVDGSYRKVRAFHSVTVTRAPSGNSGEAETTRRYVTIDQVQASRAMSDQVVADALERLGRWRDRYEAYRDVLLKEHPELEDVFEAAEQVV